jgi:hypothetical protein
MDVPAAPRRRRRALHRNNRKSAVYAASPSFKMRVNNFIYFVLNPTDTEIDWKAYMQQIAIFNKGERDYKNIEGDTGPLVYPGAHVLIYRILHGITDQGKNVQLAQYIFGLLYLSTLAVVIQCYRKAKVRLPFP